MITVSAFAWVPPFAQGLVRDLRVRWALEEAGEPYRVRLLTFGQNHADAYRAVQPFGQVPAVEGAEGALFESGAIVLDIAERSPALMPEDSYGRARARTWLFAALNTVEPPIQQIGEIDFFHPGEAWTDQRRPQVVEAIRGRLAPLAERLADRDYLEDRFTAGDLMMTTVLRMLRSTDLLTGMPALDAYRLRCEDRPAFRRALAAHIAPFAANAPADA